MTAVSINDTARAALADQWEQVVAGLPEPVMTAAGVIQHNHGNRRAFAFLRIAACVLDGPGRVPLSKVSFSRKYSAKIDHHVQHLIADGWLVLVDPGDAAASVARAYGLGPTIDAPPTLGQWAPDQHPADCEEPGPHPL